MNFKKLTGVIIAALVMCNTITAFAASNELKQKRIYGQTRYETAVKISKDGWDKSDCAVVCRGDNFPDALCAVPLAKKYNAPILLIGTDKLDEEVKSELERLNVKKVFIAGGQGVISKDTEKEIKNISGMEDVVRLGGKDRYETSNFIAESVGSKGEIVLTSGIHPADALSISSIAANKGMPIILADNKEVVNTYLNKNKTDKSYIIGGEACVSKEIENMIPNSERIFGNNRYETNEKIIKRFSDSISFKNVYLALAESERGDEFADALTGAALAAKGNNPIVLVNKDICENTKEFIKSKLAKEDTIVTLGGEEILPNYISDKLSQIKNNNSEGSSSKSTSSSGGSSSSSLSGSHSSSNDNKIEYKVSKEISFPGAFTYDLKVVGDKNEILKGYKLLYDGKVISEDKDKDGLVRPLSIFFGKDIDKSKFKIIKDGAEINFKGLNE